MVIFNSFRIYCKTFDFVQDWFNIAPFRQGTMTLTIIESISLEIKSTVSGRSNSNPPPFGAVGECPRLNSMFSPFNSADI